MRNGKTIMKECKRFKAAALLSAVAILLLAPSAWGRSHNKSNFEYVAGTESMPKGCKGKLEVTEKALVFQCSGISLTVPYDSITQMEYRPSVSKQIRKMKLDWAIKPTSSRSKHEGFFSVLFSHDGQTCAIILKVPDETMRPYMAEIDLKTGRPIHSRKD
jgi:hypothetical protein